MSHKNDLDTPALVVDLDILHIFGKPKGVVGAAIFLASKDSDYFQAQTLYMDGGIMIQQMREMRDKK